MESGASKTKGDNKSVRSVLRETISSNIPSKRDEVQTARTDGHGVVRDGVLHRVAVSCAFDVSRRDGGDA